MKASIVIPTVDRRAALRNAVDGALAQIPPDGGFEVVVVDNSIDSRQAWIAEGRQHLRYVAEPCPGLSQARNAGIATAVGDFIVFLDDDETPDGRGWLTALLDAAAQADAAFGPVMPRYESEPRRHAVYVAKLYTRDLGAVAGADVTGHAHLLGSGNSCFRRASCFPPGGEAFKTRYNLTGGEDTELIRRLVVAGKRLAWAPQAMVFEYVPVDRMTLAALAARRFAQGQMRSAVHLAPEIWRPHLVPFWMGVGALQFAYHTTVGLGARALGRGEAADLHRVQSWGGLGKVLWGNRFRRIRYGAVRG